MTRKLSLFIAACLTLSTAALLPAQVNSMDQLTDLVVNEFRNVAGIDKRVAVRDFRVPCSIANELTSAVKTKLKSQGYQVSLVADYEIEGRIKTSTDYQGIQRDILKLKIINPSGFDRTEQFSISPGLVDVSCKEGKEIQPATTGNGTGDSGGSDINTNPGGTGIPIPQSVPKAGRHQVYPQAEWKVYQITQSALRHMKNGFILNRGDWQTFWALCNVQIDLPPVDFQSQIIRVETVPFPQSINAEVFSIGNGTIDVTKDISNEPPAGNGFLNGHILIINKSDIKQKRKVRLGVTLDATWDNRGVTITSVVPDSPVTRGRMDSGNSVALESGDVILSLDGISTNSVGTFASLVKSSNGLLRAEVKNVRNGDVIFVTFELN